MVSKFEEGNDGEDCALSSDVINLEERRLSEDDLSGPSACAKGSGFSLTDFIGDSI